jgi:hypothetical protein
MPILNQAMSVLLLVAQLLLATGYGRQVLCRDADGTTKVELLHATCCSKTHATDDGCPCEGSQESEGLRASSCDTCTDTLLPDDPASRQAKDSKPVFDAPLFTVAVVLFHLDWVAEAHPSLPEPVAPPSTSNSPLVHLAGVVLRI